MSSPSVPIESPPTAMLQQDRDGCKALAAQDNGVCLRCASSPTLIRHGIRRSDLIETRSRDEVLAVSGRDNYGHTTTIAIAPAGTRAINYA
jgi:hypothetical protein